MKPIYNPEKHHRRSIRLKGHDYSQIGYYFVTVCTYNRQCLFGDIRDGKIFLNQFGNIVLQEWERSPMIRKEIEFDTFILMPNHIHGIIIINQMSNHNGDVGANGRSPLRMKPKSISSFIAGFKSITTKKINFIRNTQGTPVWQRNYYEHIIRNENELNRIREYIINNPLRWEIDRENPDVAVGTIQELPIPDEQWEDIEKKIYGK